MNASEIADSVRKLCFLPQTSEFTDQLILDEVNVVQRMALTPAILRANGEYLTEIVDLLPDATTGSVTFPKQAVASTTRVLTWLYDNDTESQPLQVISLGDEATSSQGNYVVGSPTQFVDTPDGVRILGGVPSNQYLRVRFSRRPGKLIIPSTAPPPITVLGLKVLNIVVNGSAVPGYTGYDLQLTKVTDNVPVVDNGFSAYCDVSKPTSPYRPRIMSLSFVCQPAIWNILVPVGTTNLPQVGDIVTVEDTAWNAQFPDEWHDLLCYYGAARMAGLRKDRNLKAELLGDASSFLKELINEAQPRTKLAPKVINAMRGHIRRPWRWG